MTPEGVAVTEDVGPKHHAIRCQLTPPALPKWKPAQVLRQRFAPVLHRRKLDKFSFPGPDQVELNLVTIGILQWDWPEPALGGLGCSSINSLVVTAFLLSTCPPDRGKPSPPIILTRSPQGRKAPVFQRFSHSSLALQHQKDPGRVPRVGFCVCVCKPVPWPRRTAMAAGLPPWPLHHDQIVVSAYCWVCSSNSDTTR